MSKESEKKAHCVVIKTHDPQTLRSLIQSMKELKPYIVNNETHIKTVLTGDEPPPSPGNPSPGPSNPPYYYPTNPPYPTYLPYPYHTPGYLPIGYPPSESNFPMASSKNAQPVSTPATPARKPTPASKSTSKSSSTSKSKSNGLSEKEKCICKTAQGERCQRPGTQDGVCTQHKNMMDNGKQVQFLTRR